MRLAEFASLPFFEAEQLDRSVIATTRFLNDYAAFVRKFPDLRERLKNFIQFRKTARSDQPFNDKDKPMKDADGLRRCHLILGKALVLYLVSRDTLKLIDIVEHDSIEGRGTAVLRQYISGLTQRNFHPFQVTDTGSDGETRGLRKLSAHDKEKLIELFKILAFHPRDRSALELAANGNLDEFLYWARYALGIEDSSQDRAIIQALGGRQRVMHWAQFWINETDKARQAAEEKKRQAAMRPQIPVRRNPKRGRFS